MLRWAGVMALVLGAGTVFFACDGETLETTCDPGTEVFCKCRGGDEGTKTCLDDGESFGECTTNTGSCPEIEETTSTTSGSTVCEPFEDIACECDNGDMGTKTCLEDGSSFGDCLGPAGSCGQGSGDKLLYAVCADGSECVTGTCSSGYCTRACELFSDCVDETNELYGDCITLNDSNVCAPYCVSQEECAEFGSASACGGAVALDDDQIFFAACADWGSDLAGMPYGTLCEPDPAEILYLDQVIPGECHLGAAGLQNVCSFGECTQGCYEDLDCPMEDCSSDGSVIGCCMSDPACN